MRYVGAQFSKYQIEWDVGSDPVFRVSGRYTVLKPMDLDDSYSIDLGDQSVIINTPAWVITLTRQMHSLHNVHRGKPHFDVSVAAQNDDSNRAFAEKAPTGILAQTFFASFDSTSKRNAPSPFQSSKHQVEGIFPERK